MPVNGFHSENEKNALWTILFRYKKFVTDKKTIYKQIKIISLQTVFLSMTFDILPYPGLLPRSCRSCQNFFLAIFEKKKSRSYVHLLYCSSRKNTQLAGCQLSSLFLIFIVSVMFFFLIEKGTPTVGIVHQIQRVFKIQMTYAKVRKSFVVTLFYCKCFVF